MNDYNLKLSNQRTTSIEGAVPSVAPQDSLKVIEAYVNVSRTKLQKKKSVADTPYSSSKTAQGVYVEKLRILKKSGSVLSNDLQPKVPKAMLESLTRDKMRMHTVQHGSLTQSRSGIQNHIPDPVERMSEREKKCFLPYLPVTKSKINVAKKKVCDLGQIDQDHIILPKQEKSRYTQKLIKSALNTQEEKEVTPEKIVQPRLPNLQQRRQSVELRQELATLIDKQKSTKSLPANLQIEQKSSITDYDTICVLGRGSFGTVNLVRHLVTQALFAVKIISKQKINMANQQISHILNERDILRKLNNANYCVHISSTFQDEHNLYLLLEYLPGGELHDLIKKQTFIQEGPVLKFYAAEIISAVEHLHGQNIVFRDLKPENILLDSAGHTRLIDFGFSKQLQRSSQRVLTNCGTPGYSAPEVMLSGQGAGYDAKKADIWSFGVLLCDMVGGFTPFSGKQKETNEYMDSSQALSPQQIVENIMQGRLQLPKNMSSVCKDLVRSILVVDPNMRPEIADIKTHKFFRGTDWDRIAQRKVKPPFVPPQAQQEQSIISNETPQKTLTRVKSNAVLGDYHLKNVNKFFKDF